MKQSKTILVNLLFGLLLLNYFNVAECIKAKFTNLQCEELNKTVATFKRCILKALSRDKVRLNLHIQMHKLPLINMQANFQLFIKGNGYRPFMYNDTFDFCSFLKNQNRYIIWKIAFAAVKPSTNVNHTCPINHDLIIDGLILRGDMFDLIPFPSNDYMIQMQYGSNNSYFIKTKTYIRLYD